MPCNIIIIDNEDGSWTIIPTKNFNGQINLSYIVADGKRGGETQATQSFILNPV